MAILDLPNEILGEIANCLELEPDLAAFVRVNRRLYDLLVFDLYKRNRDSEPFERTAECHALFNNKIEVLRKVYSLGVQLDSGQIFFEAAEAGYLDMFEFLLENGPSHGRPTFDELIYTACKSRRSEVVRFLLENGANANLANKYNRTPIFKAVTNWADDTDAAEVLVQHGAELNIRDEDGWSPFALACRKGKTARINFLIEKGVDVNAYCTDDDTTALHQASRYGWLSNTILLLKLGADPLKKCQRGKNALHYSVSGRREWATKVLLDEECWDGDDAGDALWGKTPLHEAATQYNSEMISILLSRGNLRINHQDLCGRTAIFHAAAGGTISIVEELLRHGADLSIRDRFGATPIFAAVRNELEAIVKALLKAKPECLDDRDDFGHTIIWWAKKCANPWILGSLIQHARNIGFEIDPRELEAEEFVIRHHANNSRCGMCTRRLGEARNSHKCRACHNGKFFICHDCFAHGGLTCGPSHQEEEWVPFAE